MSDDVFALPDIEQTRGLDLVAQRTLGGGAQVPRIPNRVSIGGPIVVAITADKLASTELVEFVKAEAATSRYSIMRLTVSFHHEAAEPIRQAVVAILLQSGDPAGVPPVAWSLDPKRLDRAPKQITGTIGLTAQLGVIQPTAQAQVVEQQADALLVALGELESTPEWQFRGTDRNPLDGMYALTMVCRIPAGTDARASLAISARLERKALGVIPYSVELPDDQRTVAL